MILSWLFFVEFGDYISSPAILDCKFGFEIVLRGFEILRFIVLGFVVLGIVVLGFFILVLRKEDPLGFRILNPCFKDFLS